MEQHSNQVVKTCDVIGKSVLSYTNEKLGSIEEIVLDKVSGETKYVVLSFGGFLGMGDKLYALPWKSINYDLNEDAFKLGIDKENWPNFADPKFSSTLSDFYM